MFEFNNDDDGFTRKPTVNLSREENSVNLFEDFIGSDIDNEYDGINSNDIDFSNSSYDNEINNKAEINFNDKISNNNIINSGEVLFEFESDSNSASNLASYSNERILSSEDISRFDDLDINRNDRASDYVSIYDLNKDKNSVKNEVDSDVKLNSNEYMYDNIYDISSNYNNNNINSDTSSNGNNNYNIGSKNSDTKSINDSNIMNRVKHDSAHIFENINHDQGYEDNNDSVQGHNVVFTRNFGNQNNNHTYSSDNTLGEGSIGMSELRQNEFKNINVMNKDNLCEKKNVNFKNSKVDWKHVWSIIEYAEKHISCSNDVNHKFKSILFELSKKDQGE
ncbi:hypothetical protein FG386_001572 [Cryptosporidium ryanae]|uniref:uncharacterized protein n=1 Tax=Cryptosporidium ryanae TaxID=515981 RepID=UPI00351A8A55|nr:hypothetical protein FG386_001572 [Cryptosporidium ryanae]